MLPVGEHHWDGGPRGLQMGKTVYVKTSANLPGVSVSRTLFYN